MSHSLHRRGSLESLQHDCLLLVTSASGVNHQGTKEKLLKVLDVVWEVGPINVGSNETGTILSGTSVEEIKAGFTDVPRVRCCFDDWGKMKTLIRRLQEMDLGMSVVVSGIRENVENMCDELGLKPHSVNMSLDIWGKREKLPPEEVLEFVTMCGHGLISKNLVIDTIERVKNGSMTPEQASVRMGSPCVCGFFNPTRALLALEKYVPKAKD